QGAGGRDVAPPTEAPLARLTRHTDPVAKLDGLARAEVPLFHWDKVASLRRGDGVRQGPMGDSELYFLEERTSLRLNGEARAFVGRGEGGRLELDVLEMRRFDVEVRDAPLHIRLPGGTTLDAQGTSFRVSLDPLDRRHVVRNSGPGEVRVGGPVTPAGEATVRPGHEVEIPLVQDAVRERKADAVTWEGARVSLSDDVRAERTPEGLR